MLTEVDITSREFKKNMRGYNVDEVDIFVEEVLQTIRNLTNENRTLKEKVKNFEERAQSYVTMEANLKEALILAQKTSAETKATANKQADLTIKEAEQAALRIVREAKDEAYQAEQRLEAAKQAHENFKLEIEQLYRTELAKLKNK